MDTRMRKRVKKKFFVFVFVHSTITIHARPHIVYNSPYTVHHIYIAFATTRITNHSQFPYLTCILKEQKFACICQMTALVPFQFLLAALSRNRQSSTYWMNDTIMWSFRRPSLTLFFLGVCFDFKFFDITNNERYAHAFNFQCSYLCGFFSPFNIFSR